MYENYFLKILPDPKYGQKLEEELRLAGKAPKTSLCNAAFREEDIASLWKESEQPGTGSVWDFFFSSLRTGQTCNLQVREWPVG